FVLLFLFILGVLLLLGLPNPNEPNSQVRTLYSNDLVQINDAPTFEFVVEDLNTIELQRVKTLEEQRQALWSQTNPGMLEQLIQEQCGIVGCDPTQVTRIMYCESGGNN